MDNRYKKSRYAKVYMKKDGKISFFNAANIKLLEGTFEDLEVLNSYSEPKCLNDDETSRIFFENEFIVKEDKKEKEDLIRRKQLRYKKAKEIRDNRIGYMRISLTENCNMACKYCFVNRVMEQKADMSVDRFTDIINTFIEHNVGQTVLIQYFGGEPLLRMDLVQLGNVMLKKAIASGKLLHVTQEIVTNGTLLTDELIEYFINNDFSISISLDGLKEINDENRIFRNGEGTFDLIVANIMKYQKAGGDVSLFLTPNNANIDHFKEIITYFVEILGAKEISINTPQPYKDGWEVSGVKLAVAIQETFIYCNLHHVKYNTPANNIVFLVNNHIAQTYSCMNLTYGDKVNTWGVYVSSAGRVSSCVVNCKNECSCDFENFKMTEAFIDWHFQPSLLPECLECPATNVCGGPCSIEKLLTNNGRNKSKCEFVHSMLNWLMENNL